MIETETSATRRVGSGADWPAKRSALGLVAAGVAVVLALVGAALFVLALGQPLEPGTLGALAGAALVLGLAAAAGLLAYAALTLSYRFEPGLLVVRWIGGEEIIPLAAVDAVWSGERIGPTLDVQGFRLPGLNVGTARVRGLGPVRVIATSNRGADLSLLATSSVVLAVSPVRPAEFRRELIRRIELDEPAAKRAPRPGWRAARAALTDPVGLPFLGLALVGALAVLGLALTRAEAAAVPDDLLRLPLIGAIVLLFNGVAGVLLYGAERGAARLLWIGAATVQPVLLVAALRLVQ